MGGDLSVSDHSRQKRQRYPIEVWETANGSVFAIVSDVRGNTSLMNASERIAAAVRGEWKHVTAIIEHWPGGIGPEGNQRFVWGSETGGYTALDAEVLAADYGLVLPPPPQ
ncbi:MULTISPECIES: hypothetical protein [Gordonia]|uniref:hypothetical protein n=1 Tax=unclassified Gordonia (in: high G+C Gram-positive bacteria) TaxID=2657482 RepID=UPI0007EAD9D6|nr:MULTISPECIES: hypothetical protein [unclassified Gordonia (in: high G+C Gram-positive bacteria)]OBC08726.1 hypothetical protein A5786_07595 [Gordonia sp. 852002-50816_SCH5313054-a]OBC11819.1 hypothetical protein A5788_22525 [Gordonia sp. 852002-50816_SCH5313054-c]